MNNKRSFCNVSLSVLCSFSEFSGSFNSVLQGGAYKEKMAICESGVWVNISLKE